MLEKELKFVFFGTPDVAAETLEILKNGGYLPSLIITSPDAKKGRGMRIESSPVAKFAEQNNIPCLKPEEINEQFNLKIASFNFQIAIVVAYGKILPKNLINLPKLGSINIHYSLLPKHRGASPVESAILNGDLETGVTIQQMEYKMDTGPILAQEKIFIHANEKAPELRKRLIKLGGELLVKTLPELVAQKTEPVPQIESQATYCRKIEKENGEINLEDNPTKNYNKFRAYFSWPRTFFFKNNKRIIITDAALEDGKFKIKKIIPEGGKERTL